MNSVRRGTDGGGWRPHVQYYHMRDGRNGIFFWALWEPKRLSMAAAAGGWVGGWMDTNARAVALLFAGAKQAGRLRAASEDLRRSLYLMSN